MSSAAKCELASLFVNMKEAIALGNTLHKLGWPQTPTPVQVNNSNSNNFTFDINYFKLNDEQFIILDIYIYDQLCRSKYILLYLLYYIIIYFKLFKEWSR